VAFPEDVLPLAVELYLDGSWVDVTSHVYRRDMINIRRGRADEAAQVDHGTCSLTLNNRDGRYSPRNPMSPYYGQLTRNTPIRVSIEGPTPYLHLPGDTLSKAHTPDAAALGITGDIDIRIDVELASWREYYDLAAKYAASGNQRSWALSLYGDKSGRLEFSWSPDGTSAARIDRQSTVPVPAPAGGRMAVRVTLDVNNGASGNTTTFYYADTIAGPWTQLGDPVVGSGTTSIFDSVAGVELGDSINLTGLPIDGKIYAFELRSGINGSIVANPDFTAQTPGDLQFTDAAGRVWDVEGAAEITTRDPRFHGEVSSWPPRWDITGTDVYVPIEAAGPLRRLAQGDVLGSAMYRARVYDTASLVAYWPLEDGEGSTQLAPALSHEPLSITGTPNLASFDGFTCSYPIPVLNGAELRGAAPAYEDTGETQVRWLMAVPAGGAEDGQVLVHFYTTGSVRRWEVFYGTGGTLGLRAFDTGGTQLFTTAPLAYAVDGELLLVSVELTQDGTDVHYTLSTLAVGESSGLTSDGTLASATVGRVGVITVSPAGGIADVAIGHLSVQATVTSLFETNEQLDAWRGEKAGRRVQRLCREEGIPFQSVGDLDDTVRLGAQLPGTLVDLLREAASADMGMLFERRDRLGVGYRTRTSLYNQTAVLALDYEAHELAEPPSPVDDDSAIRNDVTVTRTGGSSARAVQETGTLSVLPPPDGVGRYASEVTVSVEYDLDLFDQAGWRLRAGTIDEARYPQLSINLAHPSIAGDSALTAAVRLVDVGDLVTVDQPPAWLPPETISQIVQGYSEDLGNFEHALVLNCSPAAPYTVATYDGTARYMPVDTVLDEDLDTTETAVDITTPTGPLWSTAASGFDILVGGERMTVTAVGSPTGTVQTLTVVRSVNGIVKAHDSGTPVEFFVPSIYAL
jgi:hypothetical protein